MGKLDGMYFGAATDPVSIKNIKQRNLSARKVDVDATKEATMEASASQKPLDEIVENTRQKTEPSDTELKAALTALRDKTGKTTITAEVRDLGGFVLPNRVGTVQLNLFNGRRVLDMAERYPVDGAAGYAVNTITVQSSGDVGIDGDSPFPVVGIENSGLGLEVFKAAGIARYTHELMATLQEQNIVRVLQDTLVALVRREIGNNLVSGTGTTDPADRQPLGLVPALKATNTVEQTAETDPFSREEVLKLFGLLPDRFHNETSVAFVCNKASKQKLLNNVPELFHTDSNRLYFAGARVVLESSMDDGLLTGEVPFLLGDFNKAAHVRMSPIRLEFASLGPDQFMIDVIDARAAVWYGAGVRDSAAYVGYKITEDAS